MRAGWGRGPRWRPCPAPWPLPTHHAPRPPRASWGVSTQPLPQAAHMLRRGCSWEDPQRYRGQRGPEVMGGARGGRGAGAPGSPEQPPPLPGPREVPLRTIHAFCSSLTVPVPMVTGQPRSEHAEQAPELCPGLGSEGRPGPQPRGVQGRRGGRPAGWLGPGALGRGEG